jgi:hypothetical protein
MLMAPTTEPIGPRTGAATHRAPGSFSSSSIE